MNYKNAKEYLYSDGSWRDIYVFDTSRSDMNRFLNFVRPMLKEDSFSIDGEVSEVPTSYEEALKIRKEHACLLSIPVGASEINCHFFDDSELELDLVPEDYNNETQWKHLDLFLSELSKTLEKEVVLTPENQPDEIYIRYKTRAEK